MESRVNAGALGAGPARGPVWATPAITALIVVALTLPRIIFAARYGLIGDEVYYAIWSFHPGFGYFDHSPAVAWVIWLGRAIFGEGEWAVRSLFILSSFAVAAALYRIALILFDDARAGAVAAIAYAVTPGIVISFTLATPDGPSVLFWVLTVWAIAEFVRSRNPNWWLAVGVLAGMGLLSKYTVVFLGAGIVLYLVTSRERVAWLRHWQIWAGGVIALAMFAPVVWIDYQRDWVSFRFQLGRSSLSERMLRPDETLRFQIETAIQLLPTLYVFAVIGIALFFARRAKSLALPLLTAAPMAAYFIANSLFGRVNPNWVAPLYPMLALIGAWTVVSVRPSAAWLRWPLDALKALHVPLGLAVILLALAAAEFRTVPFYGPLPLAGYFQGWPGVQAKLSKLAAVNGAKWMDADTYTLNGWLGYYGRMAGDPLPVFQTAEPYRYTYMPPMSDELARAPHLIVRQAGGPEAPSPTDPSALGTVSRDDADGTPLQYFSVYLAGAK
jgi:4-amino-4-deoxy-L-arabinose transferase-like glycosyltransferase